MATTAAPTADQKADGAAAALAARHGLRVAGQRPGLLPYIRQVWAYRHFIAEFSAAKHAATYNNTRLGPLWQVLTPLVNAAVYYLIFGIVVRTGGRVDNFIAFLCTGVFLFGFTQQAVLAGMKSIGDHLGLIRSLHFPRACLPIAITMSHFRQVLASMVVLFAIVLATGEPLTFEWFAMIPVLLLQSLFSMGLAMVLARFGAKLLDLKQLMPFVMRTWMYASGVLYSAQTFSKHLPPWLAHIMEANPMLVFIELARHSLLQSELDSAMAYPTMWYYAIGWALVIGIGGFIYFWRGEQEYGRG
jgi:teichoic acid transport system permease protein